MFDAKRSDQVLAALVAASCGALAVFELGASFGSHGSPAIATAPAIAHVSVGTGGDLCPDFGYEWAGGPTLRVRWVGRKRYASLPHVASSAREGSWDADPGYALVPGLSPRARWVPGQPLQGHPHVVADACEGRWSPEAGYEFASAGDFAVRLKPVTPGPVHPNVTAVSLHAKSGSSSGSVAQGGANAHHRAPTQDQVTRAILDVAFAAGEHALSRPQPDDGWLAASGREVMRAARDATFNDALHSLFPDRPPALLNAAGRVLTLAVDGRLTVGNWASATARDVIISELRKCDPADADVIDIADFIVRAVAAYKDR